MLDCRAFGGQAGASARIENYLGFPTGISGMALMARAYNQAQKFGAEMAIPEEVGGAGDGRKRVASSCSLKAARSRARTVVVASGAEYRRLMWPISRNMKARMSITGHRRSRAQLCAGQEVALVGAGNSAGQAAVYLARRRKRSG